MSNVKVKINRNTMVEYKDVDVVALPTSDGGTALYKKWDGTLKTHISDCTVLKGHLHECAAMSVGNYLTISCEVSVGEST